MFFLIPNNDVDARLKDWSNLTRRKVVFVFVAASRRRKFRISYRYYFSVERAGYFQFVVDISDEAYVSCSRDRNRSL